MRLFVGILALLLPVLLVNGVTTGGNRGGKHVLCFFEANAAVHENAEVQFFPEDLDVTICTHVVYYRVDIGKDLELVPRNRTVDLQEDNGLGIINRTLALKHQNPGLELLFDVYDTNGELEQFKKVGNRSALIQFASNAADFVQRHGFDGMVIRFSNIRKSTTEEMKQSTEFLVPTLHEEFSRRGIKLMSFLLPISTPNEFQFELTEPLSRSLDLILVGSYWKVPGEKTEILSSLAELESKVNGLKDVGIPMEKLVVAIPAFSITMKICNDTDRGIKSDICAEGDEGAYVQRLKPLVYSSELTKKMANSSEEWVVTRDPESGVSYGCSKSLLWGSFEDSESVRSKAEFVLKSNLGGVAIMSSNMDDFRGSYSDGGVTYPLTRAAYDALNVESLDGTTPGARTQ